MEREAKLNNSESRLVDANLMKYKELQAIDDADLSILVSAEEMRILQSENRDEKLAVMPLVVGISGTQVGFDARSDIVFIGGSHHPPNIDAIKYFCNDMMPKLRQEIPNVKFNIIGANPPDELLALQSNDILFHGYVEDLDSFLSGIRVSVAPMRFGAGMKGKVITTMGVGLPTVMTKIAAEGIVDDSAGELKNLVTDDLSEYVEIIKKLYFDKNYWSSVSRNQISHVDKLNGMKGSYEVFSLILSRLGFMKDGVSRYPLRAYNDKLIST
jgi:hypothetical protein